MIVLAIPDTHAPFEHRDCLPFLAYLKKTYSPKAVVHLGDEVDFHALSQYDHDPDGMSPGDELKKALAKMKDFYDLFPNVKVCTSNHTDRPFKKAYKHGIPSAFIKSYKEFLKAPAGWDWADHWEIDGVRYEHGESYTGAAASLKMATGNMQSTVHGHLHSHAGIHYSRNVNKLYYGFNVGCLIDTDAYAFRYGKNMKDKPVLGAGIIHNSIPHFIPMLLDKKGRWIKS